ncbi:hypothetical protein SAMN05216223_109173 [Actinacidiphila yanglinensis]|uniref:Uncharacterized protein n=2 Tax=Actinacidiphila yanglinensis TaxID=310779 RepID=A0A1H6CMP7_9ACTN|nr:hypothetical protein SAMN05216223_109173 [Actinacidiphila yanglinensis]
MIFGGMTRVHSHIHHHTSGSGGGSSSPSALIILLVVLAVVVGVCLWVGKRRSGGE